VEPARRRGPARLGVAKVQILRWATIPVGVRARDGSGDAREHLPDRFQHAVDFVATATGRAATAKYLAEWKWGALEQRDGDPKLVARTVLEELLADYPSTRLAQVKAELIEDLGRAEETTGSKKSTARTQVGMEGSAR